MSYLDNQARIRDLEEELREAQAGLVALQSALFEKGHLEEENQILREDLNLLKERVSTLAPTKPSDGATNAEQELYELHQAFSSLMEERNALSNQFHEKSHQLDQLEKTVHFLREKADTVKFEKKELEEEIQSLQKRQFALQEELARAKDATPYKDRILELETTLKTLQKERLQLKDQLQLLQREKQRFLQREDRLSLLEEALPSQLQILKEQKQALEELVEERSKEFERQKKILCQKIDEERQKQLEFSQERKKMEAALRDQTAAKELVAKTLAENRILEEKLKEVSFDQKNRFEHLEKESSVALREAREEVQSLQKRLKTAEERLSHLEPLESITQEVSTLVNSLSSLIEKKTKPPASISPQFAEATLIRQEVEVLEGPQIIERHLLKEERTEKQASPYQSLFFNQPPPGH
jgi:Chromosome segregation ATPases